MTVEIWVVKINPRTDNIYRVQVDATQRLEECYWPRNIKFNSERIRILGTLGHQLGEGTVSHAAVKYKVLEIVLYGEMDAAAAGIAARMVVVAWHRAVETTMETGEEISLLLAPSISKQT